MKTIKRLLLVLFVFAAAEDGLCGFGDILNEEQAKERYGLTTAAGVWATAGVGMAAGGGLYLVSAGATVILIAVQCILHLKCKLFTTKKYIRIRVCFDAGDGQNSGKVTEIFGVERFSKLNAERKDGKVFCTGTVTTTKDVSAAMIAELLTENDFIRSIERCDDE